MAAALQKKVNHPLLLNVLSPCSENKIFRSSIYAISTVAIAAAAWRYGNTQIGFTLASAGCFVQGYQIIHLAQEIKNTPMDNRTKNQKISRITDRVFALGLVWGIIMSGLNLSLVWHEGSAILQHTDINAVRLLFEAGLKDPRGLATMLTKSWLKNAPAILYRVNTLGALACISIPQAYNFIYWGDDLFYGKKLLVKPVYELVKKAISTWTASGNITLFSLFFMIKDIIQGVKLWSYLSNVMSEVPQYMIQTLGALRSSLPLLARIRYVSMKDFNQWIHSFSNPLVNRALVVAHRQNSGIWEKIKYVANYIFFYTFNLSLLGTRLYYHPFPTGIFFGVGLFCPTTYQTEITIQRTWEIAPDFIGLPLLLKIRYIWDRTQATLATLSRWNIPAASLEGLYLAEAARYYARHLVK